jgi:hypothetical protein
LRHQSISGQWDVAFGKPRLKLRVLSRASQSAFAVIVNASVDLLFAFNGGKHFVNHSSALHARKAPEAVEFAIPAFATVGVADVVIKFVAAVVSVALTKAGTDAKGNVLPIEIR